MAPTEDPEDEADGGEKDDWLELMDGIIRKRMISPGEGSQPQMKMDVICSYEVRAAGSSSDEVLQRRNRVRYRIGEGEAVPCLELGLRHMLEGEEADIFGVSRMAWGPSGLPAAGEGERDLPAGADVLLRVVLHECLEGEAAESSWNKQIQDITWRKENGNDHFRRKQFPKAIRCYGFGLQVFQGCYDAPEEVSNAKSASAMAMSIACDIGSNLAAAHLEMGNPSAARDCATEALQVNPDHVKCLYRAAKACFLLDNFEECEAAIQRALLLEPENAAVKRLEADFKRKKQRYAEKRKRVEANMFAGLQYPDTSPPAGAEAKAEAPREASSGGLHEAGLAVVSWMQERRWYIVGFILSWVCAGLLCCALPRNYWPCCIMVPTILFPIGAGLVVSRGEEATAATSKKQQ